MPSPTQDDRRLLEGVLWIGREAKELYRQNANLLEGLNPAQSVFLAIATLNREFWVLDQSLQMERNNLPSDEAVSLDYLSNIRVENVHGQRLTSGDFTETAIDATESWLFDSYRLPTPPQPFQGDAAAKAEGAIGFYSMRNVLKNLYYKALHEGRYLVEQEADLWSPLDEELVALNLAWQGREEASFLSNAIDLRFHWSRMTPAERRKLGLKRSATGARVSPTGKILIDTKQVPYFSKRPTACALERAGFADSSVGLFMHQRLPKAAGLMTPLMLADAWWVLADAARHASKLSRLSMDQRSARRMAATVDIDELERCLIKALRIDLPVAQAIIEFLTFKEQKPGKDRDAGASVGYRGLWSAPLVPVPGEAAVAMPVAVFITGNSIWRVEAWLEKGGIDDRAIEHRGDQFEKSYRAELVQLISGNPVLRHARFAADGVKITKDFREQIDLVMRLGDRLIVGELKFLLTPADPSSLRLHFAKLADAAGQATRKAEALRSRPGVVARALGIPEDDVAKLAVQPIIVLNHGFGFSMEVQGCRVIEAGFLRSFLSSGRIRTGGIERGSHSRAERVKTLYETEAEAGARFDEIMARPPLLMRLLDRISWDEIPYPRPTGGHFRIKSPFRGDITDAERAEAASVVSAMQQRLPPSRPPQE